MKCEYEGCNIEIFDDGLGGYRAYALYELREDFTKIWRSVCFKHDKIIAQNSRYLRMKYPDAKFTEVWEV